VKVDVRYFASVREALGPRDSVEVSDGATLADVRRELIARGGRHAEVLAYGRALRMALDQTLSDESAAVSSGAEVAIFPPVTGG
jgi:molybdopterin synthase sulfur carrier subunit